MPLPHHLYEQDTGKNASILEGVSDRNGDLQGERFKRIFWDSRPIFDVLSALFLHP
jgi:hypothetical protein